MKNILNINNRKRLILHILVFIILISIVHEVLIQGETEKGKTVQRSIAMTIDDLPVVRGKNITRMQRITSDLLRKVSAHKIPTVGFVNEQKLGEPEPLPERIALLQKWVDAGFELGNHTYSHPWFYTTPLAEFKAEVIKGETVLRPILEAKGKSLRYFRHPQLNTGPDRATKEAFDAFLKKKGYVIAPVTIDNSEFIYALAYDKAEEAKDKALMNRIGIDYLVYMNTVLEFYEQLSQESLGKEPAQILLIHANALNADWMNQLVAIIHARGYQFITLEQALKDPVYSLPDTYTGKQGISWIQRWRISKGGQMKEEPEVTAWVDIYAHK